LDLLLHLVATVIDVCGQQPVGKPGRRDDPRDGDPGEGIFVAGLLAGRGDATRPVAATA
jgi:hypothetical protein